MDATPKPTLELTDTTPSTSQPPPLPAPTLRVARATSNISALLPFYTTGLGLTVLSSFTAHNSFDGTILGHPGWPYHLEFTTYLPHVQDRAEHSRAPSQDNLLVFYIPERAEWEARVKRMEDTGFEAVKSFNPWWDGQGGCDGRTFEDCEGWRVVLWNGAWER